MSNTYTFGENDGYKSENVLDTTLLVEDGIVWDQEEVQVSLSYEPDVNGTMHDSNNALYLTANNDSSDAPFYSILETSNETMLNDLSDIVTTEVTEEAAANVIGHEPDLYRIEGSDDLYAFDLGYDTEGNLQRIRYRLRLNENDEYESVPDSIEFLSFENETQLAPTPALEESENQGMQTIDVFVKQEVPHEGRSETYLSEVMNEDNVNEESGDELQVNEDAALPSDGEENNEVPESKAGILQQAFLSVSKTECEEPNTRYLHDNHSDLEQAEEEEEQEEESIDSFEHDESTYEPLQIDQVENAVTNPSPELIRPCTPIESEEDDDRSNLPSLEDDESDNDDYHIVDGVHVTADTETPHVSGDVHQKLSQVLKMQQTPLQIPTTNSDTLKEMINNNFSKAASPKGYSYYVVKRPEKENVATINKIARANPRSILKSSYVRYEQQQQQQKDPPVQQKVDKKTMQARVFQNFIARTTIIHAPIRQERLPRKQTIKPVERADEEIIVQEVVVSSNGFVETTQDGIVKSKMPLKPNEIVQLSDSDDDYDPKRENKKKRKKRKSKITEIVISDDSELEDEVVEIDLSESEEDENNQESVEASTSKETTIKRKRGRPPKRRNSSETTTIPDTSISSPSKKQRHKSIESSASNKSDDSKIIKTNWKCPKCPKAFPSQGSLKTHMQYHTFHEPKESAKYECSRCGETLKNNFLLMKHLKVHTNSKHECSMCQKVFIDKLQLINHKRSHVKEQMFNTTTLPKHLPKSSPTQKTNQLKCKHCTKVFTSSILLTSHMKTHKTFTCPSCKTNFMSKLVFEEHVRYKCVKKSQQSVSLNTRRSFMVPPVRRSQRISMDKSVLNTSVKTSASVTCDMCTMKFATYRALFNHKVNKHGLSTPSKDIKKPVKLHSGIPANPRLQNPFATLRSKLNNN